MVRFSQSWQGTRWRRAASVRQFRVEPARRQRCLLIDKITRRLARASAIGKPDATSAKSSLAMLTKNGQFGKCFARAPLKCGPEGLFLAVKTNLRFDKGQLRHARDWYKAKTAR
jgi:hypothetical protein